MQIQDKVGHARKNKKIIKVESFSRNCILIRVHANSYCNILLECMFIENLCNMLILKVFIRFLFFIMITYEWILARGFTEALFLVPIFRN